MAQSNFIFNETLSGTVDGVNTTFTSLYPIDVISYMRLGGADYVDFSFAGKTVELADAPTAVLGAPSISYFRADTNPIYNTDTLTLLEVRNQVYEKLSQNASTSMQYPQSLVDKAICNSIKEINNQFPNPRTNIASIVFNLSEDLVVTEYSATKITTETQSSYVPASGMIVLGDGEYITYSSKTSTEFTGLTGLNSTYKAGDSVRVAYPLPTNCNKISEVFINGNRINACDPRFYTTSKPEYTIVYDEFIVLPKTNSESLVTIRYEIKSIAPVNDSDLINFPKDYDYVLAQRALYEVLRNREDTRWSVELQEYNRILKLYQNYLNKNRGTNQALAGDYFNKWR